MLIEKQKMEAYSLYFLSLLGNEKSVEISLNELSDIQNSLEESSEKMKDHLQTSNDFSKKEILNYFRWSLSSSKNMEKLRIALAFTE